MRLSPIPIRHQEMSEFNSPTWVDSFIGHGKVVRVINPLLRVDAEQVVPGDAPKARAAQLVEDRGLRTIVRIKRVAAVFLLIAFFLPLSQCTAETANPDTKTLERRATVTYAYAAHEWPSVDAVATYGAFIWPLVFAVTGLVRPRPGYKLTTPLLEILFSAGSGYILLTLIIFRAPLYGWYIASASIGAYFIATLAGLFGHARRKWENKYNRLFDPTARQRRFAPCLGRVTSDDTCRDEHDE